MSDNQYNSSLTIFFVSYAVFEPLTNVLLKRLRPSVFIPIIMILWVGLPFLALQLRYVLTRCSLGYLHVEHGLCP